MKKVFRVTKEDLPSDWSNHAVDFIKKCLKRNPKQRLGYACGVIELK